MEAKLTKTTKKQFYRTDINILNTDTKLLNQFKMYALLSQTAKDLHKL